MKNKLFYVLVVLFIIIVSGCEVFTIKGKKIVQEESAIYTQASPIGIVKIFITELQNENYLAAADLMLKENGTSLNASEKYDATSDLARMKRYIEGKTLKKETIDTALGNNIVILEYTNANKVIFYTLEKNKLFYITSYKRE
ncbi:MAG: hypothetical protein FWG85_05580 [Bacteroidetes bacterium]|nr:hypothetical protein [Bacteroidota bacterium]